MKINKLFAILFAVLGVQTLSAQVEWTSKTNLLTNPSFETDAAISDLTSCGWATDRATGWTITPASSSNAQVGVGNASSTVQGIGSTFSPSEGSNYFYTRNNWNANTEYTISQTISTELPAGLYKVTCKTATYSSDAALKTIELSLQEGDNDPVCQNGIVLNVWNTWGVILMKESDDTPLTIKARMIPGYGTSGGKHYAMLLDDFQLEYISPEDYASASVDNPIDFSALINNSIIYNHNTKGNMPRGWTAYLHTTGNGNYTEKDKCDTRLEGWSGGNLNIDYYQTINNLPPGKYQVTALAQERSGNGLTNIYIYSDPNRAVGAVGQTEADYSTEPLAILSGTANIGIQSTANDWVTADNFRIKYVGEDLSMYETQYTSAKTAAESAITDEAYITVIGKERTDLHATINANVEETKAAYLSAISTLETATAAFKAATSDYATLATEKEIAAGLGMSEDAIATATATTKTGLDALQDLKVAEYNYIQQTYTEAATLGSWTENFAEDLSNEGYKPESETYFNEWGSATRTAKQTITLPAGNYALSVIARGQAGASGYLYYKYGETTSQVNLIMKGNSGRGVDVNEVANFSDEGTYNNNGNGFGWEYRFITFNLAEETAVEIGASATIQGQWASIYAPVLLTTEASIKTLRMTEITNLLSEVPTGKMNATVQSTLDSKKAAAEAASTENSIEELATITTELNEAITAAKASIADYELIAGYIAKANKIGESIAADYQTAYNNGTISESAETVFQNLEVATYQYVTDEFTYEVELEAGGWVSEGPVGSLTGQHYDGTSTSSYLEQSQAAYNLSSWEISYKYEKTLPAGEYIFKVAGRRVSGTSTTMSMQVSNINDSANPVELGSVNDFPEGDEGLGINKKGAASFDAKDEAGFANDNKGRGWQWRYVRFKLESETTVQVAINAAATTTSQWMSFCKATVQMSEETYLEANKGALDAPTAAAEALVDTKPMGDAENTALKEALAMTVNTGAQLQAKINALNTAVANANAWVAAYNEAKAPLVAALDRFETDYNLEGDVDHAYMSNSVWANVLTMVQAASEAKDVTNSYDGFAAATENLVAALDAADVSIAEYAALKEALDNANAAATVNWGDQPFQRPTEDKEDLTTAINAAQAVYDAANGEDVTSQTTTLNDALDVVNNLELNAPAEGAVYNIVVATAGHDLERAPVVATFNGISDYNPTGYGFAAKDGYTDGPANMLYTFTKVKGNNYYISVKVKGETVYLTIGSLNGSAAGWNQQQIQGTTDIAKAANFEIVASNTTEGVIKIRNTVYNEFLDSQDDSGNIYTDTNIENEDFALTLVEELSAEISIDAADKYATCVLMFDADLANTDGLTVYVPESYTTQGGLNYFVFKVFEEAVLPAYTPCLLYAKNGFEGTLTGEVKMDGYAYNVAERGYLYGALESQYITEGYVMVKLDDEEDVKFRNVSQSGITEGIKIPAGKCWLQVPAVQESVASFTCLFRGGDASNIDEVLLDKISVKDGAIYTLDGKRVSNIERGKIYVINGQKVIVK